MECFHSYILMVTTFILVMIYFQKNTFYYKSNSKIIISSELSNLIDLSKKKFDKKIIYSYLSFGHLIDDKTYENIFKLKPGQILTIDKKLDIKEFKYFDPKNSLNHRKSIGEKNIKLNLFHEHIENSLKLNLIQIEKLVFYFLEV